LKRLGLIYTKDNKLYLTEDGQKAKDDISILYKNALKTEKINFSYEIFCRNPSLKKEEFKEKIKTLLTNSSHQVYIKSTSRKLYEWAELIYKLNNRGLFNENTI